MTNNNINSEIQNNDLSVKFEINVIAMSQIVRSSVILVMMDLKEFTEKIIPLRPDVLVQAQRLTGDDNDAEDLVQEVMLKLWTMRESIGSHPNVKALSFTILQNKHRDAWRHRQVVNKSEDLLHDADCGYSIAESLDETAIIRHIMDHLPPLQNQIIRMKEIEGYSSDEIMQITGCSADSIRQNLSRARRKIREEYIRISTWRKHETI